MSDDEKILAFLEEIDSLKSIERKGYLKDHSRHDNPAEHTWHMMVMLLLLKLKNKENFDLEHALCLCLVHDMPEIYTGDTPRYDSSAREAIKEKEQKAAKDIFSILPDDIAEKLLSYWQEFEENKTPEAKFANHCDYLQGFSQSYFARGKSWREMGITKEKTRKYTTPITADNQGLAEFIDTLYKKIENKKLLD